jgi:hypothetical protein
VDAQQASGRSAQVAFQVRDPIFPHRYVEDAERPSPFFVQVCGTIGQEDQVAAPVADEGRALGRPLAGVEDRERPVASGLTPELRSTPQILRRQPRHRSEARAYPSLAPSAPSSLARSSAPTARCPPRKEWSRPRLPVLPAAGPWRPVRRTSPKRLVIGKVACALIALPPRAR